MSQWTSVRSGLTHQIQNSMEQVPKQMNKEENQDIMKISVIYLNFTHFLVTINIHPFKNSKRKIISLLNTLSENPGINMRLETSQASLKARTLKAMSVLTQF